MSNPIKAVQMMSTDKEDLMSHRLSHLFKQNYGAEGLIAPNAEIRGFGNGLGNVDAFDAEDESGSFDLPLKPLPLSLHGII